MNDLTWQTLIVGVIVGAAVVHLLLRCWRFMSTRAATGCHGCHTPCGGSQSTTSTSGPRAMPFVSIDVLVNDHVPSLPMSQGRRV